MTNIFKTAEGEEIAIGDTVFIGRDGFLHKSISQAGHNSLAEPLDLKALLEQLPTVDQLHELLLAENADALKRVDLLLNKGVEFLVIENDQQDSDATEFLVKLRARYKGSEADRIDTKSKFDDLAGSVQAFFQTKILQPLGGAPSNKNEQFDPVQATHYGMGVRITMAQTLYKREKAERERKEREANAARLREAERVAAERRKEEERVRRAEEDRIAAERREQARKLQEEEDRKAEQRRKAAQAEADRLAELELAASRKRNEKNRADADAAAAKAREDAKKRQEEADRQAEIDRKAAEDRAAKQLAEDNRLAAEREERDRLSREEENKAAEARAAAEEAAAATTADLSRARGGKGGVSSLREFVDFRDVKIAEMAVMVDLEGKVVPPGVPGLPPSILLILPFIKDAAIESAIKDFEKANKATVMAGIKNGQQPVRGVTYFMNSKSAGRA